MRREILAPFSTHHFLTTEAERVGRGDVRLERGSGSYCLTITDRAGVAVEWRVRVQVKLADAGAGMVDLGAIRTVPPSKGSPPHRIVCFLSVPGAVGFMCDFTTATVGAVGEVGFGECPYIGEPGLVASQWALLESERARQDGAAIAPAFNGVVQVQLSPVALRRLWSVSIWQRDDGCLVSPLRDMPYTGAPVAPTIPIPPGGALTFHPGGGQLVPFEFSVGVMGANAGGWVAEWGD